ncbi:zinc ribbon domain-containing protein [Dapis sp. BLCC M229]|uniref:zinc ribbon domain-containing protein n=1 Tax=Dapis sp. BLCC M229 TaxID=3400188 RepID=UPI003CF524B9
MLVAIKSILQKPVATVATFTERLFKCPKCQTVISRDINGARNIMIRGLQATAFTVKGNAILCSS